MLDENRSVWCADKEPYAPLPALAGDARCDVAVIGGGFTGVSTAYHLARRFPERRVMLLEARALGHGASGRNGGLMLTGVNGYHPASLEAAGRVYHATREGIALIASIIAEHRLTVRHRMDGCLEVFTDGARAEAAARAVEAQNAAGVPLRFLDEAALARRLRVTGARGAVLDPAAGVLDGIDYLRALRPVLVGLGVAVHEGTPVLRVREGAEIRLETRAGTVRAGAVVLATNAYTPRLGYFRQNIFSLRSHVVASEPLAPEAWEAIGWGRDVAGWSDDRSRLAYGSITPRGELVFGGGSNAAYGYSFGGDARRAVAPGERSVAAIRRTLAGYLPGAAALRLTHRWSGPVALTLSRLCTMGVRGAHRNVYYALGYSGHGITLANLAGRVLTDIYSGDDQRWRALPFYQQRLLYIPPEPLRFVGYHLYTRLTGRSPRRTV